MPKFEKDKKVVSDEEFNSTVKEAKKIIAETKGKRGFQPGNKLATKVVKEFKAGAPTLKNLSQDPLASVSQIMAVKKLNAANEMIKAAMELEEPNKRFNAWLEIQKFIEGQRKSVDIKVSKTEEKTITIVYQQSGDDGKIIDVSPQFKKVSEEIIPHKPVVMEEPPVTIEESKPERKDYRKQLLSSIIND